MGDETAVYEINGKLSTGILVMISYRSVLSNSPSVRFCSINDLLGLPRCQLFYDLKNKNFFSGSIHKAQRVTQTLGNVTGGQNLKSGRISTCFSANLAIYDLRSIFCRRNVRVLRRLRLENVWGRHDQFVSIFYLPCNESQWQAWAPYIKRVRSSRHSFEGSSLVHHIAV